MRKEFEYFFSRSAVGLLDVEDIGNCAIEANDDIGNFYYIVIETKLGFTKIFEYGPCNPDFNELPKSVACTFDRIEFNDKKIANAIYMFLNNGKRNITQAQLVEKDYALDGCIDIIEYMRNSNNF